MIKVANMHQTISPVQNAEYTGHLAVKEVEYRTQGCIICAVPAVPRELSAGGVLDYQIYRVENHWLYPHFANTILVLSMQHRYLIRGYPMSRGFPAQKKPPVQLHPGPSKYTFFFPNICFLNQIKCNFYCQQLSLIRTWELRKGSSRELLARDVHLLVR